MEWAETSRHCGALLYSAPRTPTSRCQLRDSPTQKVSSHAFAGLRPSVNYVESACLNTVQAGPRDRVCPHCTLGAPDFPKA